MRSSASSARCRSSANAGVGRPSRGACAAAATAPRAPPRPAPAAATSPPPGRRGRAPPRRRGSPAHRARLVGERAGQPLLHRRARDRVERAERLVEQQHRAARRAACAGTPRAGASRRTARAGSARSNSARPKRSNSGAARAARLGLRGALALERQRGVAERVAPGQQQVALGHVRAGSGAARSRAPPTSLPPSGSWSPAISSSSVDLPQPDGPDHRDHLAARARARSTPSSALTAPARRYGATHRR